MADDKKTEITTSEPDVREQAPEAPAYEPPRLLKKRSVSRVTLFTGGGVSGGGITAGG